MYLYDLNNLILPYLAEKEGGDDHDDEEKECPVGGSADGAEDRVGHAPEEQGQQDQRNVPCHMAVRWASDCLQ